MKETVCRGCGNKFVTSRSNKIFCRRSCQIRTAGDNTRALSNRSEYLNDSIPTGTIGAIHELMVCTDLMRRGFHVFRAQSQSCPCDLICMNGLKIERVEVRTGHRNQDGKLIYPTARLNPNNFDILAVIFYSGEITYLDNSFELKEMTI